jgi:hypothetical protein
LAVNPGRSISKSNCTVVTLVERLRHPASGFHEPPPVAARLKKAPLAVAAMPDRPVTETALVRLVVVPSPSWP